MNIGLYCIKLNFREILVGQHEENEPVVESLLDLFAGLRGHALGNSRTSRARRRHRGPSVYLAFLLAGILFLPASLSQAEMASALPEAGGDYVFIDRAGEVLNLVRPVDEQLTHEEVVRAIRKAREPEVVLKMFREEPASPVG